MPGEATHPDTWTTMVAASSAPDAGDISSTGGDPPRDTGTGVGRATTRYVPAAATMATAAMV